MNIFLHREPPQPHGVYGEIFVNGNHECLSLENHLLLIAAGRYKLSLEKSPHFGDNTLTVNNVPNRTFIRIHGGTTERDSEGCILVGDKENRDAMTIAGAKFDHVLDRLKEKVAAAIAKNEIVWLDVKDAS